MARYTHLQLAAQRLLDDGRIGAFEAVYQFTTPDGRVKRNTRLAATIWTLRREYGWDIQTVDVPGHLADYILKRVGGLPEGVVNRTKADPVPPWRCGRCGTRRYSADARLGGFGEAYCESCKERTIHSRVEG